MKTFIYLFFAFLFINIINLLRGIRNKWKEWKIKIGLEVEQINRTSAFMEFIKAVFSFLWVLTDLFVAITLLCVAIFLLIKK